MASVTRADMLTLWRADEMAEFSEAQLRELGVPDDAARVLAQVGLPAAAEPFFYSDGAVHRQPADHQVQGWRFGGDGGAALCLESKTGQVIADGTVIGARARFVNSSVEQFAACLHAVVGRYRQFAGLDDEAIDALIGDMEARLAEIDGAALEGEENWWAVLIEQMHDGLL